MKKLIITFFLMTSLTYGVTIHTINSDVEKNSTVANFGDFAIIKKGSMYLRYFYDGNEFVPIEDKSQVILLQSCKDILNAGLNQGSGVYKIKPTTFEIDAYCDMTTDGGGWTLVLNYLHQGGTNPELSVKTTTLPLKGSDSLGENENNTKYWGHISNSLASKMDFKELQFYCKTSNHSRIIHFKTDSTNIVNYTKTGVGAMSPYYSTTSTNLSQRVDANIPLNMASHSGFSSRADYALTEFPIYQGGTYHWGIRGLNTRWECDDYPNNYDYDTLHRVFVR